MVPRTARTHAERAVPHRGRAEALADFGWVRISGFVGWLLWLFVHIMFLVGFRNRLSVLLQWAASYFTYQRSVRLITGDTPRIAEPAETGASDVQATAPDQVARR